MISSKQVNSTSYHKPFNGEFNKIIDIGNIDACKVVQNLDDFPMIKHSVYWLNMSFPNLVHKCPYEVS